MTRFNRSHLTKPRQPPARRTISQEGSIDDGYEAQGYHRADQGKRHRVGRPALHRPQGKVAAPDDGRLDPRRGRARSGTDVRRSEEHTSELQSLMRISYAVLSLKKKNTE